MTGLDAVKKAVERVRDETQAAGVDATFVVGDATHLHLGDEAVDSLVGVVLK
ncbi:class I SAM-dependent methyltransferase [Mycobacteroides franklinii]|uniref:class I SAM-dependent methyltransferase n=1 Tax=Mycobacteroides franklinii TaxID=948102 RepID=UPI000D6A6431